MTDKFQINVTGGTSQENELLKMVIAHALHSRGYKNVVVQNINPKESVGMLTAFRFENQLKPLKNKIYVDIQNKNGMSGTLDYLREQFRN